MGLLRSLRSRKLFWLAVVYATLLISSGIYRFSIPAQEVSKDKKTILLNTIISDQTLTREIHVAYKDSRPVNKTNTIPIILIHGSPGSADAFDGLTRLIPDKRIIAIDLPGFGDSEMNVPDYSIRAHAKYVLELMDKLKIEKAHFVGFSLGSGVVLHIAGQAPERVESISFISAIGVQEYELLGNYYLNRIIHGAQLAFFWSLRELTPHFGVFGPMMVTFSQNFYDSDQRPLRGILERIDRPFLIIHGKDDPLVPVEAAREHARLVPQSEYHELDENHFFVFMRPEKVVRLPKNFWTRVENGTAITRATANSERITRSREPFKPEILKAKGPTILVLFFLIVFLIFLNEDLAFLLAGFFAGQGRFGLEFAIIVSIIASILSIFAMLLAGRMSGRSAISKDEPPAGFLSGFKRKPFAFHFLRYFRCGKNGPGFWKHILIFSVSAALWAVAINSVSYLFASLFY